MSVITSPGWHTVLNFQSIKTLHSRRYESQEMPVVPSILCPASILRSVSSGLDSGAIGYLRSIQAHARQELIVRVLPSSYIRPM